MRLDLNPPDQGDLNVDHLAKRALSGDQKVALLNPIGNQCCGCPGLAHKAVGSTDDGAGLQGLGEQVPHAQVDQDDCYCDQGTANSVKQPPQIKEAEFAFNVSSDPREEADELIERLFHAVVLLASYPTSLGLWALILFDYSTANQHWPLGYNQ